MVSEAWYTIVTPLQSRDILTSGWDARTALGQDKQSAPCKGNPDCGIQEIFAFGSRNVTNDWNFESELHWEIIGILTWNLEYRRGIQNSHWLSWIPLYGLNKGNEHFEWHTQLFVCLASQPAFLYHLIRKLKQRRRRRQREGQKSNRFRLAKQ